ncbi:MAG: hydratase [Deinococcota bacterium]|nr:hydratase [Deinococcota bacterium]
MTEAQKVLADELAEARVQARTLPAPSIRGLELTFEDAYAVQGELSRRLQEGGYRMIGRKIGLTNQAVWPAMGLDRVIWGPMYDKTVQDAPEDAGANRATLPLDLFVQPRLEPEIVFGLREAPPVEKDAEALLAAAEWVALGFELVQCHYPDWKFTPADAVADYGLHGALVIGERQALEGKRLGKVANALRALELTLYQGGEEAATGAGKNVVGSPALALGWLAGELQGEEDAPKPGEVVTTGSLTAAMPVEPGQSWRAELRGLDLPALELSLV